MKPIPTQLSDANAAAVTALLRATPHQLAAMSASLPDDLLRRPLCPGERSFVEIVSHLLNSEARVAEAIGLALLVDEPLLPGVHPERQWGRLLRYHEMPVSALIDYFALRREMLLRVLESLTPAQWARTTRETGKQRQESVYRWARSLALHEREHVMEAATRLGVEVP